MSSLPAADECIRIRGARTHNLRNIDLDLPRGRLVVLTGPSGSGKSSLAFDTLFAEGQRQYIESLSAYARQFLNQLERPDVDLIDGLEPTICIDQRAGRQGPRSTVATVTEIYDYLRLLYARLGDIRCWKCGSPIRQQTPEQIQETLLALPEGTKLMLLAPVVRGRRGEQPEAFQQIRKAGFVRVRVNGEMHDVEQLPPLDGRKSHTIEAVVDRVIIRPGSEGRLVESLQLALKHGDGLVTTTWLPPELENQARSRNESTEGLWTERLFSTLYACPDCGIAYEEIEPRTFSFNSPYGACPTCAGIGARVEFDPEAVIPDDSAPLSSAIAPWKGHKSGPAKKHRDEVEAFLATQEISAAATLADLSPARREKLFRGDGKDFPGLLVLLEKELATATDEDRREELETFRGPVACPDCGGTRLRPEARAVFIGEKNISAAAALAVDRSRRFFAELSWPPADQPVAAPIVGEILKRLDFLHKVGLTYLSLDRPADTLSGGELQRLRLATGIGSGLVGVCYILDEPSIGLHPRDNDRLMVALRELQALGNTVIVVEHDEAMMRTADWLIDIGPGAGSHGGRIVAQGTPAEVAADEQSLTGAYLSGRRTIDPPAERRKPTRGKALTIEGVTTHNLKNVAATFPLGLFICVTGVSGSGKSSLINETLAPALLRKLGRTAPKPGPFTSLRGADEIKQVIIVDQSPVGRSPRSNPATFTGVFEDIRKVFAATKDAKQLGFKANRFSFNTPGGRCEECQGYGVKKIEMNFLPDIYVTCTECGGGRYNRQTLQVKYKGKTIADVLAMPCDTAAEFFRELSDIHRPLASLCDVGLGYLPLGQSATTLSGGESQRIKLATELAHREEPGTLYILDEPTTGLHFEDVRRLLGVLQRLVDRGHTVIVIEHHVDVMRAADHLIDLGPDGGAGGGEVVAVGTPEELAKVANNFTAAALRAAMSPRTLNL